MSKLNKATPVDPQRELVEAGSLLLEARLIGEFISSIGYGPAGHTIDLDEGQTSGFCFVMGDMLERIKQSDNLIGSALKSLKSNREGQS